MPKVSVILGEKQQVELQALLVESDGASALQFLKEVVWAQVQVVHRKELRSHLDKGAGN